MTRFIFAMAIVLVLSGCTMPMTKTAMTALEVQNRQYDAVEDDLVRTANQLALDNAAAEARTISDSAAMIPVLEKLQNRLVTIAWLDKQWTAARFGPGGIITQYVYAQQGWASVLVKQWNAAKVATQPAGAEVIKLGG